MKILVIRFSSIGDIVLTTPVVRCIKKQLPEAELHYVTKAAFEDVLKHNPYIDKLWLLKDNFAALAKQLRQEHFDYVVDLHGTLRRFSLGKVAAGRCNANRNHHERKVPCRSTT